MARVTVAIGISTTRMSTGALVVEQHLFRILGEDTDLNSVNLATMADRYIEIRREEKAPSGQFISFATIRQELLIIQQGCRRARDYGQFTGALALIVPESLDPKNAKTTPRNVRLTLDQYLNLLRVATVWRRPWLVFGVNTEIDIGPTHRIHKEHDILWDLGQYGSVEVPDYKTPDRPRIVPLNADARAAVDLRMDEPGEFLFEPMWSSNAFRECMKRWCPAAGIPERIRWKDLRRSFASLLGDEGAPQSHVAKLMGHSAKSGMVEKVYQHLEQTALQETVSMMPTCFGVPTIRQHSQRTDENQRGNRGTPRGAGIANSLENAG